MQQRTVCITGASRGIGRAIAYSFAQQGYHVAFCYHSCTDQALKLKKELEELKADVLCVQADVRSEDSVCELFAQIREKFGGVDVLINNAGIALSDTLDRISVQAWDDVFAVNVRGTFLCSRAAAGYMINKKWGRIINISSMWGVTGASCETAYSASKAAVIGFTRALAKELGPSNITVNAIAPGVIDTDMNAALSQEDLEELRQQTPLMRIGTAEDVAQAALFLAGAGGDFVTGQVISPNGGFVI